MRATSREKKAFVLEQLAQLVTEHGWEVRYCRELTWDILNPKVGQRVTPPAVGNGLSPQERRQAFKRTVLQHLSAAKQVLVRLDAQNSSLVFAYPCGKVVPFGIPAQEERTPVAVIRRQALYRKWAPRRLESAVEAACKLCDERAAAAKAGELERIHA